MSKFSNFCQIISHPLPSAFILHVNYVIAPSTDAVFALEGRRSSKMTVIFDTAIVSNNSCMLFRTSPAQKPPSRNAFFLFLFIQNPSEKSVLLRNSVFNGNSGVPFQCYSRRIFCSLITHLVYKIFNISEASIFILHLFGQGPGFRSIK